MFSDCVNLIHKHCFIGNIAVKISIRKAFNTLSWHFLLKVLESLRFNAKFRSWIHASFIRLTFQFYLMVVQNVILSVHVVLGKMIL